MSSQVRGSALLLRLAAPTVVAVSLVLSGPAQVGNATAYATPIRVQAEGGALQRSDAAAPAGLSGNNATQANNSSSGAITQTHQLAGSNATQTTLSSPGAIVQSHVLSGLNATQANNSSSGAVASGATHVLTGANVSQSNQSSTGGISQSHVLSGLNAVQNATSGTGSIAQTHALAGNPSTQNNASTSGALVFLSETHDFGLVCGLPAALTSLITSPGTIGLALASTAQPVTRLTTEAGYVS